jgi:oligosaccharide repeat unit polymerase
MNINTYYEENYNFKWGILFLSISLSGIVVFSSGESWISIISLVFLGAVSINLVKFDVLHPYTWYVPFFLLYSNAYPTLILLGEVNNIYSVGYNILIVNWIALSVFLICVGPELKVSKVNIDKNFPNFCLVSYPIYIFSIICTAVSIIYIYIKGLKNKYLINLDNSIYTDLGKVFYIYLLCFSIIIGKKIIEKNKIPWTFLLLNIAWVFICFTINGERDWLLKILWVSFFLINVLYRRVSKIGILLIGFICVLSVPILNNLKNIGVAGETKNALSNNIFVDILGSEFGSSGRNLYLTVDYFNVPDKLFFGQTLLWDFLRGIFGFGISPTQWFNLTFFPDLVNRGGGNGFSFMGEGYMNFGIFGVIIWMFLLSIIIKKLYTSSYQTLLHFIIYILSMSVFVYILRADFANLFSSLLKQIVLPILFMWVAVKILKRERRIKKREEKDDRKVSVSKI